MLLCQVKGILQIVVCIGFLEFVKIYQVRPVFVYQCIEGHAISPASGEIVNVDVGVPGKDKAQRLPNTGLYFS